MRDDVPLLLLTNEDTLEILYQAVGILSCRTDMMENQQCGHPNARHALCAREITSMIDEKTDSPPVLLRFVPYAAALSLSVVYRHQHTCVLQTHRARDTKSLSKGVRALRMMGRIFWSAGFIARMAERTFPEGHDDNISARQVNPTHSQASADSMRPSKNLLPFHHSRLQADFVDVEHSGVVVPSHPDNGDSRADALPGDTFDTDGDSAYDASMLLDDSQIDSFGVHWSQVDLDAYFHKFLDPAIPTAIDWAI